MYKHFKNEDDFYDSFPCSYSLPQFVESISGDNRWWFKEAYEQEGEGAFVAFFNSYITPEYKNFLLTVHGTKVDGRYVFTVGKIVTDLA